MHEVQFCGLWFIDIRCVHLSSEGVNVRATPFIQYRRPVGCGPSLNTWPRWPEQREHCTSVRGKKKMLLSSTSLTPPGTASKNEGHPVPLSNLAALSKTALLQPAHWNVPDRASLFNGDENGSSVEEFLSTLYCFRVSKLRHCSSEKSLGSVAHDAHGRTHADAERVTAVSRMERRSCSS